MPIPPAVPFSPGLWFVPSGDPLLPRLVLDPTMSRAGLFDGAWWPRSNDIRAELPDLITALGAHLGRIVRVGLATTAWADIPRAVTVNGFDVKVGRCSGEGTISLTRGFQDHFLLLVVPPDTDPLTAATAMAGAAAARNHQSAAELLTPRACSAE